MLRLSRDNILVMTKLKRNENMKMEEELKEALKELLSIVKMHSKATDNNFAWAEVECAEEVLARANVVC